MIRETPERHQKSDSPFLPNEAPLSSVHEDNVPGDVDGDLYELHQRVVASKEHIANLEGELKGAADQEAETAQILDSEHQRRAALDQELHEAREEAARLIHDEASQTSSTIRAEAEKLLQATRVQAEREAGRVTKRAFDEANEIIATATQKLGVLETTYDELVATLKLVAETSIEDLVNKQDSLKQHDRMETHGQSIEPNSDQTTSGPPPQETLPTDLEATPGLASDDRETPDAG